MKIASTMKKMVDAIAKQESDARTDVVGVGRRRTYSTASKELKIDPHAFDVQEAQDRLYEIKL